MSETGRRLKINRRYAASACPWCGDALAIGDDGAVCEACESPHHAICWDRHNGCNSDPNCVNRPLTQIPDIVQPVEVSGPKLAPGDSICPTCGQIISGICFRCHPDASAPIGRKNTAQEASDAFKLALFGLLCFGIILGPIAFVKATRVKRQIALDPTADGSGLATAAQVLGILEVVVSIFSLMRLAS